MARGAQPPTATAANEVDSDRKGANPVEGSAQSGDTCAGNVDVNGFNKVLVSFRRSGLI